MGYKCIFHLVASLITLNGNSHLLYLIEFNIIYLHRPRPRKAIDPIITAVLPILLHQLTCLW